LKYVQEQIENAKGDRAIPDFMDEDSSDEDDEEVSSSTQMRSWLKQQGEFYTEGTNELLEARRKIARYSLSK
jgi:U4/U6 small nuclear ribonucleoprotein PRP4